MRSFALVTLSLMLATQAGAQTVSGLVWRNVGPFRAGRVSAVSGAIGEPGVFYAGFPAAGLWKTTNAGATWEPIFDQVTSVSSIGAVEVAPSDTSVIYVGTGDKPAGGNIDEGDGVYRSSDAGRTWQKVGLDSTKQIPSMIVDPRNPNVVLVAAQGDLHARGGQRGLYRTTDAGRTWTRTLYVDDVTGIEKLGMAFDEPDVVFATTDRHWVPSVPPPPTPGAPNAPPQTGLFKSTDGGATFHEITGGGLPRLSGRVLVWVAMKTRAQRVFIIGNFGLYRSDDGGTTWRQLARDDRRIGNGQGGYNSGVLTSPDNPDVIYTINTSSYVSRDGGTTFTGFKGAPGGDDPQVLWIDPTNGQRMLMGMDQGAVVTLDGGRTWSSWFNQSTEQVYHVSVDSSFPYWIYATQQDAGAVRTRSRGNYGAITPMDWSPAGTWEWGTIVADPLNPNIVYGSGAGIQRVVWPSEQFMPDMGPGADPALTLRNTNSQPLLWNPFNPRELLYGANFVFSTIDGGHHWRKISPDLGWPAGYTPPPTPPPGVPPTPPAPNAPRAGAIESMSYSRVARGQIWVGTNTGLIKLTRDGGLHWTDVSIPNLPDSNRSVISGLEASHHDAAVAYVAIDAHGTGDYAPQLYRTRDYGASWQAINTGLPMQQPGGAFTRLIREDTQKAGLLFAGTESGMFVSFDDGDHWTSLQLNMPTVSSFRDALIVGYDLVVGTYGRGIWILDDISPLRQLTPDILAERAHLFAPGGAVRVHRNVNQNTPMPPETPHALNPPEGVAVYYSLSSPPAGAVTLEVLDASGTVIRHLTSAQTAPVPEAARPPEPSFWIAPPHRMPAQAGINRTNWDLRMDPPPAFTHSFDINANPFLTPASPQGPMVRPGTYTLRLTVDGTAYTQPVTVRNDPRVRITPLQLNAQADLQRNLYRMIGEAWAGYQAADSVRATLMRDTVANAAMIARIDSVAGRVPVPGVFNRPRSSGPTFFSVHGALVRQLDAQDLADEAPTAAMMAAYTASVADLRKVTAAWSAIR